MGYLLSELLNILSLLIRLPHLLLAFLDHYLSVMHQPGLFLPQIRNLLLVDGYLTDIKSFLVGFLPDLYVLNLRVGLLVDAQTLKNHFNLTQNLPERLLFQSRLF